MITTAHQVKKQNAINITHSCRSLTVRDATFTFHPLLHYISNPSTCHKDPARMACIFCRYISSASKSPHSTLKECHRDPKIRRNRRLRRRRRRRCKNPNVRSRRRKPKSDNGLAARACAHSLSGVSCRSRDSNTPIPLCSTLLDAQVRRCRTVVHNPLHIYTHTHKHTLWSHHFG